MNQVEADHIGLDDLAPIATLLFVYGTAVAALDPDDADAIAQADRVEQLLDDDAPIEILHLEIYKLGDMTDTTRGVT